LSGIRQKRLPEELQKGKAPMTGHPSMDRRKNPQDRSDQRPVRWVPP
jgi:ribonuclease HI